MKLSLKGNSSIKSLKTISELYNDKLIIKLFDKKIKQDFTSLEDLIKNPFQPNKNYFYAAMKAEEILLDFIVNNQNSKILNTYYQLNPIFIFSGEQNLFEYEVNEFSDQSIPNSPLFDEWIGVTTNYPTWSEKRPKILFYKMEANKIIKIQNSTSLNLMLNDDSYIQIDCTNLLPEYSYFIENFEDYILYSGIYKLVELENLSSNLLNQLSSDYVLAKYVARHLNINENLSKQLILKNDIEVNTALYSNPKLSLSEKKKLLKNGVLDEDKYSFYERISDVINNFHENTTTQNYKTFLQSKKGYDSNRTHYL